MRKEAHPARLVDGTTGAVLVPRLRIARGFAARTVGLLGRSELGAGEGLLIERCGCIHTCGMRFPIDAVFLDGAGRVLRVAADLRPWRMAGARGARAVCELPAGEAGALTLQPGRILRVLRMAKTEHGGTGA